MLGAVQFARTLPIGKAPEKFIVNCSGVTHSIFCFPKPEI